MQRLVSAMLITMLLCTRSTGYDISGGDICKDPMGEVLEVPQSEHGVLDNHEVLLMLNSDVLPVAPQRPRVNVLLSANFYDAEVEIESTCKQDAPLLFVGVLSAPANLERRKDMRTNCMPFIKDAGYDVKFFIGLPNDMDTIESQGQGQKASDMQSNLTDILADEIEQYNDIVVVPFRELYTDQSFKTTKIFRYGLQLGVHNIMKLDDDSCPHIGNVTNVLQHENSENANYVGENLNSGSEYDSMIGKDGTIAPFMAGAIYIISYKLAYLVFYEDISHTLLYHTYGTSSEDANMGKWYAYAEEHHPDVNFNLINRSQLLTKWNDELTGLEN